MSTNPNHHGQTQDQSPQGDETEEGESDSSEEAKSDSLISKLLGGIHSGIHRLLSLDGVFLMVVVAAIVGSIFSVVYWGNSPLQILEEHSGLILVAAVPFVVGSCFSGVLIEWRRKNDLRKHRVQLDTVRSKVENLVSKTSTGEKASSTENQLDLLITAAENGNLGTGSDRHATSSKRKHDKQHATEKKETTIGDVIDQMPSHRLPPADTAGGDLVTELQSFDSRHPGSLKDALEELKELIEDIQLMEETFSSASDHIVVSDDPKTQDFQASNDNLCNIYNELNTGAVPGRPPALVREHVKNFVEAYRDTVKHFQSYHDRMSTPDDRIDLRAAGNIETNQTVNLPPGSTAEQLITDLQKRQDGPEVERTLKKTVDELNSYRSLQSSLDSKEQLQQNIDSLHRSIDSIRGPISDVLREKVKDVERLLSRTGLSEMNEVQHITLQERLTVLEDLVAELSNIKQYQNSDVSVLVNELGNDINEFVTRYTDNREWNHFNHSIPNKYLSLVEEFHEMAAEAADHHENERARTFVQAAEETLNQTEKLYQKPEFTSLLDPTVS